LLTIRSNVSGPRGSGTGIVSLLTIRGLEREALEPRNRDR
jgi:hypothetical protein